MIRILITAFAALAGLAFGSFLNVCVTRWPEGESIVAPRSRCRSCARALTWWENIPIASWLVLGGRCRTCKAWIGWRYPLVELATGALWALVAWRSTAELFDSRIPASLLKFDLAESAVTLFLLWILVALAALDAENFWLPDSITLPVAGLGFVVAIVRLVLPVKLGSIPGLPLIAGLENMPSGFYGAVIGRFLGILAAALLILLIRWIYKLIRKREGIGLGDAKLMAMLAAWLGLEGALLSLVIGVALGAAIALAALALPSKRSVEEGWALKKLPLGAFLCIGGIVSALWGQPILAAYLRWAGF